MPEVYGWDEEEVLPTGEKVRVVRLNNAATTPPFVSTVNAVNDFLRGYSSFHRGAGPLAERTHRRVTEAIAIIRKFVGVDDEYHALLFPRNTSDAINLFTRLWNGGHDVVLSEIEHTSNHLPWRKRPLEHAGVGMGKYDVKSVRAFDDGGIDYDELNAKASYIWPGGIIAITGASNLTGYVSLLSRVKEIAQQRSTSLFIDAAQLAPHRPINMSAIRIEALSFSAHKLYAPFGPGVLVLPKRVLDRAPLDPAGGSIEMINEKGEVIWASPEDRHQTGTWNTPGIIALAESCRTIMDVGWDAIMAHERELVVYMCEKLSTVPGLVAHVPLEKYRAEDRIGTFPFTLMDARNAKPFHHALLATILGCEYGVETRAGTICNHRLVRRWFNVSDEEQRAIEERIRAGDRLASYGVVRASLGIHNTNEDIDRLVEALICIGERGPRLEYRPNPKEETFDPVV